MAHDASWTLYHVINQVNKVLVYALIPTYLGTSNMKLAQNSLVIFQNTLEYCTDWLKSRAK